MQMKSELEFRGARVRVLRANDFLTSGEASRTLARFVVHCEGHSLGNPRAGRRAFPSGSFASVKAGVAIPWIKHRMRALVHELECDPDVTTFLTWPHRLELHHRGKPVAYEPDVAFDRVDGSVTVASFPPISDFLRERITRVYEALGWAFEELDQRLFDVHSQRAKRLQSLLDKRLVFFSSGDLFKVHSIVGQSGGRSELATVLDALGGGETAIARLYAMHFQRAVRLTPDPRLEEPNQVENGPPIPKCGSPTFRLWEIAHG